MINRKSLASLSHQQIEQRICVWLVQLGEELWHRLGNEGSLAYEAWPEANRALLVEDTISLAVQVNGKRRDQITVARDAPEEVVREAALACDGVRRHLAGREPSQVIVVAGRLVNVVG